MLDKLANKSLSFSIIVGTLLVPLAAGAAIWLTDPGRGGEETSAPTTTAAPAEMATMKPTTASSIDVAADLKQACGAEGNQLVALEESESITDVQQAALDALREVCEQERIPLPSKALANPIVQTVVVRAATNPGPVPNSTATTSADDGQGFSDERNDEAEEQREEAEEQQEEAEEQQEESEEGD